MVWVRTINPSTALPNDFLVLCTVYTDFSILHLASVPRLPIKLQTCPSSMENKREAFLSRLSHSGA